MKRDEISGFFGSTAGSCDYRTIFVGENGNLTLEGGTFRVGGNPYPTTTEAIYCRGGSVTVKDGVTISQLWFHDGCYARDLDGSGYALHTEGKSKAIIAGGVFYGHVKLSGYQDTNVSVQISGGTSRYTVSFESNGGSKVSNQTVTRNSVMKGAPADTPPRPPVGVGTPSGSPCTGRRRCRSWHGSPRPSPPPSSPSRGGYVPWICR